LGGIKAICKRKTVQQIQQELVVKFGGDGMKADLDLKRLSLLACKN
jgi:hypothetical protein